MKFCHFVNKFVASVGGVILVLYEFSQFYENYIPKYNDHVYIMDNSYIPFSTFFILSLSYMFLNIFSPSKNSISNSFKGLLGCFLITCSMFYFMNQVIICSEYAKEESTKLRFSVYFCVFLFLYMFSLCIESYKNFSFTTSKYERKEPGTMKVEV
ncbi:hypothetical protein PFAG_01107 [Plasmodium falciparum Santa Lucia]|uniref:MARVEL domain-containing protein n=14 Tax=Plasmodium falciparum TaxID=5833 RepID=Q8I3M3_PLAF7|nr:conserved Plasmodium membrane protein, unknown function [Plasmodium falciparum 3D7]ETW19935.1 hypothetical protein PFFVO_01145 [Plasmodium falciparum Vietnam Oak-Knoll (FVO)]ETW31808.1 hypothetical protein PFFCH_00774 [Plasmodium falciparum FCH/4]ETW44374.1 hypothetical protein PFNF135_01240 [Plasmodium falciparum NF135/5.C10]ETW53399.1 hypothetical protein PFUGPA_04414 [Plasmodium falciparum Palo Alto/Uganda]ETW63182.1 hypothetical protein PFMC_01164 [Plasmodium falciparum CAMP/Malaysia]E|eukprot:XP_001351798.1 conserved Plasmodium membrane protein, unknown function [Plasmodium falciparum 3D7]